MKFSTHLRRARRLTALAALASIVACSNDAPPRNDSTQASSNAPLPFPACVITQAGIAPVKLGMTLAAAKTAMPGASFVRSSDGEGVALVDVKVDAGNLMTLYAGEEDPASAVDSTRVIENIETFNPECGTAEGIHPGSLLTNAQKVLGEVTSIFKSEIESREFVQFARQPARFSFRLDYTGIFSGDSTQTRAFKPGARIFSIAVRR
jgi:hypothetical protein